MNVDRLQAAGVTLYRTIRRHLDRPAHVVHEPCRPRQRLAVDATDAPAGWTDLRAAVSRMPPSTRVRVALVAGEMVLPWFEEYFPDDPRPRQALNLATRWLCGEPVGRGELRSRIDELRAVASVRIDSRSVAARTAISAASAAVYAMATAYGRTQHGLLSMLSWASGGFALVEAQASIPQYADFEVRRRAIERFRLGFLRRWWTECQSALPVQRAFTSKIEWAMIG